MYLSTAIGLTAGGSSTVHIYTQTVHRTTQITTNLEECGPCPVFASFTPNVGLINYCLAHSENYPVYAVFRIIGWIYVSKEPLLFKFMK